MGAPDPAGLSRVKSKERTNYGPASKVNMKRGPAAGSSGSPNPTKGGGINRATKGK